MANKWFIQLKTGKQIEINNHNVEKLMRNTNENENLKIKNDIQTIFVPIRNIEYFYQLKERVKNGK